MAVPRALALYLFFLAFASVAWARTFNVTIDDEYGDSLTGKRLTYFPNNASWTQGSDCKTCLFHLDTTRVSNGTWHDASQHPDDPFTRSITAQFNGTAVYVYNVLAAYLYGNKSTVTYMTFEIDGVAAGAYGVNTYDGIKYNVPVLAKKDLADGPHTLVIRVEPGIAGKDWSFVLFDRIEYTTSDDAAQPPNSTSTTSTSSTQSGTGPGTTTTSSSTDSSSSQTESSDSPSPSAPVPSGGVVRPRASVGCVFATGLAVMALVLV